MKTRLFMVMAMCPLLYFGKVKACTTFVLKQANQIVYGRNFDFNIGSGYVVNNLRGITKYAHGADTTNILRWTSKYGSLSFNQAGKEFPYGGMNETGLVVALMYLPETQYPAKDSRKSISALQWIQYHLDTSSTIEEVMASDQFLRISNKVPVGVHYLVCDAKGQSAAIEFLDGALVCHTGEELPIPLLTNNTYKESMGFLEEFNIMGGPKAIPWKSVEDFDWTKENTNYVNQVFATAAGAMVREEKDSSLCDKAFDVLQSVSVKDHTQWSTVFDVTNKLIYFKNVQQSEVIKLDFNDFNFECEQGSIILDIQTATSENVMSQFVYYTPELNRRYVFDGVLPLMEDGFLPQIPMAVIEAQAQYPETLIVKE